jgi:Na+/H+-dicarboxylate symporter
VKDNTRVLAALIGAVVFGAAIGASGNASLLHAADTLTPIGTVWVNAIRMTVIPLVVSLIVTGVASATDVKSVGRIGGRSLLVFVVLLSFMAAVIIPLASLVFTLLPPGVGARPALPAGAVDAANLLVAGDGAPSASAWLMSLIPTNPIAAAASGAMLPLVIFTLLFALAITRIPRESRELLLGAFRALSEAMLVLVHWVIRLTPIGVFALVLPLTAHLGATVAGAIGFYVVAYSGFSVFAILLLYPIVAMVGRMPVRTFARAVLPPQLIALSTSSSIASLPALVESAENELRLPKTVTGFVVPLAVSTFKICGPVSWSIGALFVAWFYGIPLHSRELLIIAGASVFLAFGIPGVPRGAFLMLAPLFLALGLPVEGIGILLAVDAIPDTFATALNVTGDLAATVLVARGEVAAAAPGPVDLAAAA